VHPVELLAFASGLEPKGVITRYLL